MLLRYSYRALWFVRLPRTSCSTTICDRREEFSQTSSWPMAQAFQQLSPLMPSGCSLGMKTRGDQFQIASQFCQFCFRSALRYRVPQASRLPRAIQLAQIRSRGGRRLQRRWHDRSSGVQLRDPTAGDDGNVSLVLGRRPQGKQLRRSTRTPQELRIQRPSVHIGGWL